MQKEEKIESIINEICKIFGTDLYEWKLVGYSSSKKLIIYITKKDGVSIDDCADFSSALSHEIDKKNVFESSFSLEVSSPGLNRELKKEHHFCGALGEKVKVKFRNGQSRDKIINGILTSVSGNEISVQKSNDNVTQIYLDQIKKASTVFK